MNINGIQNYINHIALVVDRSGSMSSVANTVVKVFDNEINYLRRRSQELNQETRTSVYTFGSDVNCLVFDMDCMRMPSLSGYYQISGMTALIDATTKAVEDMQKLPELYGDHAFLLYVLTDGEENASRTRPERLSALLDKLPDNWTVVCLVPNAKGIHEAKKFGFSPENLQIWDATSSSGVETMGTGFRAAMENYMQARAKGVRGTKSFFKTDLGGVSVKQVESSLVPITNCRVFDVRAIDAKDIKGFVQGKTGSAYVSGSAYYQLMKPETVQAYKQICIEHKHSGKIYGGDNARKALKLPDFEVRVSPGDHGDWNIFVQSTSVNRKLIEGTRLLVLG